MYLSFEKLKKALLENVVLNIADPTKPYVLEVDASDYAVGGVLQQEDASGDLRPVAFFSRKLQGSPGKGQVECSVSRKGDLCYCIDPPQVSELVSQYHCASQGVD